MGKLYISIGTYLLFFTTSCTMTSDKHINHTKPINQSLLVDSGKGKGGNPEVEAINQCFNFQAQARNRCIDSLYPNSINITIYEQNNYRKHIQRLATRGASVDKREFNLGGEDRFILHLNVSETPLPVKCNIPTAKLYQDRNSLTVNIAVKDIQNRVILYTKDNRMILNYTIIKD